MRKDEIFIDGIRKYICVGYSETEKPIYELSPEYEKYNCYLRNINLSILIKDCHAKI